MREENPKIEYLYSICPLFVPCMDKHIEYQARILYATGNKDARHKTLDLKGPVYRAFLCLQMTIFRSI
jgi:hypothetical protein